MVHFLGFALSRDRISCMYLIPLHIGSEAHSAFSLSSPRPLCGPFITPVWWYPYSPRLLSKSVRARYCGRLLNTSLPASFRSIHFSLVIGVCDLVSFHCPSVMAHCCTYLAPTANHRASSSSSSHDGTPRSPIRLSRGLRGL